MRRYFIAAVTLCGLLPPASGAVIALGNFTPHEIKVTITGSDKKAQALALGKATVVPLFVTGPVDIAFPAKPAAVSLRLVPYHAYVFIPDEEAERRLEGIAMPGDAPERDARPELNLTPREPIKIPVTLLVDDGEKRPDELWQKTIRKRFDEAAAVVEAHVDVKLVFDGFATWISDPDKPGLPELLEEFAAKVKVKPGRLAIGFTNLIPANAEDPKGAAVYGATRPFPTTHILLREWSPRADAEKVEALIHHLGLALGAALIPDPGSVMRPKIADGLALNADYRYRFDPLNVLAMNIWVEEVRRGPVASPAGASASNKTRLTRVYKALLKERPDDENATAYLGELDRNPLPKKDGDPAANPLARDEVARQVIRAVTARAKANAISGLLVGDDLTAAYVQAAAIAAWREDGLGADRDERIGGFLIGLGVALDETGALRADPATAATAKLVETDEDRAERLKALGNPTLRGRRDLCRRFAVGCASAELVKIASQAEELALERSFSKAALAQPAGVSFPALAAEFAGIEFARATTRDAARAKGLAEKAAILDLVPSVEGLRDGLSAERFRDDYGDAADARFQKVLGAIRDRMK